MRDPIMVIVSAAIAVMGVVFSLQGFGALNGSPMSNTTTWSIAGPVIAAVGLLGIWRGTRGRWR